MRSRISVLLTVPLLLAAAACGGSDDAASDAGDSDAPTSVALVDTDDASTDDDSSDDTADDATPIDDIVAPPSGGGTAVLTLENGEVFEFDGVMCTLEPQMAAGSEILFTATSYGDPGLDITQFGDDGVVTGIASIDVWDADYEPIWEAFSLGGSTVELTLEGSTIRGTADFYDDGAGLGDPVKGEIVANC